MYGLACLCIYDLNEHRSTRFKHTSTSSSFPIFFVYVDFRTTNTNHSLFRCRASSVPQIQTNIKIDIHQWRQSIQWNQNILMAQETYRKRQRSGESGSTLNMEFVVSVYNIFIWNFMSQFIDALLFLLFVCLYIECLQLQLLFGLENSTRWSVIWWLDAGSSCSTSHRARTVVQWKRYTAFLFIRLQHTWMRKRVKNIDIRDNGHNSFRSGRKITKTLYFHRFNFFLLPFNCHLVVCVWPQFSLLSDWKCLRWKQNSLYKELISNSIEFERRERKTYSNYDTFHTVPCCVDGVRAQIEMCSSCVYAFKFTCWCILCVSI